MGDLERLRHAAGVLDVLPGAARPLPADRLAMVVELERDADHVIAFGLEQGRDHRGIDPSRHGDDYARRARASGEVKAVQHCGLRRCHWLSGSNLRLTPARHCLGPFTV